MREQFILIILSLTSGLSAMMLAYISWQRRRIKGTGAFALLCLCSAIWSLFYTLELLAPTSGSAFLWSQVKYTGAIFMPVAWFAFAVRYTDRYEELRKIRYRHIAATAVLPAITVILIWFNFDNLAWASIQLDDSAGYHSVDLEYGNWLLIVYLPYAALLTIVGFVLFIRKWIQPGYRHHLMLVLIALLLPFVGTAAIFFFFSLIDPGAIFFAISTVMLAIGVLRINVFDIRPAAYNHLLQNIPDGVLVADADDRVVMLNPAFLKYSHFDTEDEVLGRNLHEVLNEEINASRDLWSAPTGNGFFHQAEEYEHTLVPRMFPLRDERGYEIGYGLMFRDDSTERQAELELKKRVDQLSLLSQIDEEITHTLKIQPILQMALDAAMRLSGAEVGYIAVTVDEDVRVETVVGQFDIPMMGRSVRPEDGIVGSVLVQQEALMILDLATSDKENIFRSSSKAMMVIPLSAAERLMGLLVLETEKTGTL